MNGPVNVDVPLTVSHPVTSPPDPTTEPPRFPPPSRVSVWSFRSTVPPTAEVVQVCEAPSVVGTFHWAKPATPPLSTMALPLAEKSPCGALTDSSVNPTRSLVVAWLTEP